MQEYVLKYIILFPVESNILKKLLPFIILVKYLKMRHYQTFGVNKIKSLKNHTTSVYHNKLTIFFFFYKILGEYLFYLYCGTYLKIFT